MLRYGRPTPTSVFDSPEEPEIRISFVHDLGSWSAIGTDALNRKVFPESLTRLRRMLMTYFVRRDLAWTAASIFLDLEFRMQDILSASSKEFGTDEHYCTVIENIGRRVQWSKSQEQ
jgi:hypothetical protein